MDKLMHNFLITLLSVALLWAPVADAISIPLPSLQLPPRGGEYRDTKFDTTVRRLSDATTEGIGSITHAYASVNPFNSGSTLVVLEKSGGIIHIRDLRGNIVRDNLYEFGILPTSEAIWSRTDPNLLYYHTADGNELRSYDVQTNKATTLTLFSEFDTISFAKGEGDISNDGNRLPIIGDGRHGLIYTLSTKEKTKSIDLSQYGNIDSFDVTDSGAALIVYDPGALYAFDRDMNPAGKVADFGGHSDRAAYGGESFTVVTNAADYTPLDDCPNGTTKVNLATKEETCLISFDWLLAVHISCNNAGQGWCLVSTYRPDQDAAWPTYANELIKVPLDGSSPTRIAHTRSTSRDYTRQSRAAVSQDGRYVLFDSDMQDGTVDTYLAILSSPPPTATSLPAPSPTPPPTTLPTPVPVSTPSPTPQALPRIDPSPTAIPTPSIPKPSITPAITRTTPARYGLRDGDLISEKSSDPDIFIINEYGYKRLFLNPVIFNFYGHLGGFGNVKGISPAGRDDFETSLLFRNCETNNPRVYALEVSGEDTGILHWLNVNGNDAVNQDPEFFKKIFCINTNEENWYAKGAAYISLDSIEKYIR